MLNGVGHPPRGDDMNNSSTSEPSPPHCEKHANLAERLLRSFGQDLQDCRVVCAARANTSSTSLGKCITVCEFFSVIRKRGDIK